MEKLLEINQTYIKNIHDIIFNYEKYCNEIITHESLIDDTKTKLLTLSENIKKTNYYIDEVNVNNFENLEDNINYVELNKTLNELENILLSAYNVLSVTNNKIKNIEEQSKNLYDKILNEYKQYDIEYLKKCIAIQLEKYKNGVK